MGKAGDSEQDLQQKRRRHNENARLYRERNREQLRENARRYYADHKDQTQTYQKEYDRRPEGIKLRKQRWARRHRVSEAEGQRLRMPEHRLESLNYGPKGEVVCLNCFWKGKRLGTHSLVCPVTPQNATQYMAQFGFEAESLISRELRETITRSRTGKRLGPNFARRKVTDSKIREILNLGLSFAESAKLAGISAMGFYRRAQKLGWKSDFREKQRLITKYVTELSFWIKAQGTVPTIEQIADRQDQECASGGTVAREFIKFFHYLEAELRQSPQMIQQLRDDKGTKTIFTLATHVVGRTRPRPGQTTKTKASSNRRGGQTGPMNKTKALMRLASALLHLGYTPYRMAPLLYPSTERGAAEKATYWLLRRHGTVIKRDAAGLSEASAKAIVGKRA